MNHPETRKPPGAAVLENFQDSSTLPRKVNAAPPHSPEAEEHVIACCLLDGTDTIARCLEACLAPDSFYSPANRLLFEIILELYRKSPPVTLEVLAEELKTRRQLEAVGGFAYLMQVTGKAPTTAHAGYFIEKVREKHLLRELIRTAAGAVEKANGFTGDLNEFLASARMAFTKLAENGTSSDLAAISAASLCAEPLESPPMVVEGMLYRGGTGMISAPSKGHKTYTLLDMACAVADGRDWLGFKTAATVCLYVNLELADHSVRRRLAAICSARGVKPPANLHILNLRGQRITSDTLHNVIVPMAKRLGAGLIIIDPYYKISSVSGVEENSNDGQAVFLASVDNAARDANCAIIMVHHFAKGDAGGKNSIDRGSGGGVQARWPDVFATLTEHETEDCMVAEFHLRDFAPISKFVVRWACPVWVREDHEDPTKLKRTGRTDAHPAAELLGKLDPKGMTNAEWRNASGWSASTFDRKRDDLERAQKVKKMMGVWKPC